ncbi:MAG: hypothetical protein R3C28_09640 [Pirellulaceae bacterium]
MSNGRGERHHPIVATGIDQSQYGSLSDTNRRQTVTPITNFREQISLDYRPGSDFSRDRKSLSISPFMAELSQKNQGLKNRLRNKTVKFVKFELNLHNPSCQKSLIAGTIRDSKLSVFANYGS